MYCPTLKDLPAPPKDRTGWPWTEESRPLPENMPDGRSWPKISIVTPSYNQGRFIEETIRSVLLQGYPNLEYIIIDGGSTDESVEIIKKYSQWLTYWVSEPDRGQSHAINKGFAKASGEIHGWLNSDDLLLPGALRNVARVCGQHPSAVAWVGSCYFIDPSGRIVESIVPRGLDPDGLADWCRSGFLAQPSCFFAARAWGKVNGLDESLHYAMDFDLWLRLINLGPFVPVPHWLSAMYIHNEAKTQAHIPEVHAETVFVQIKHGYREAAMRRLMPFLRRKPPDCGVRAALRSTLKDRVRRIRRLWEFRETNKRESVQFLQDKVKDLL